MNTANCEGLAAGHQTSNFEPRTFGADPVAEALGLLSRGEHHEAHVVLRDAFIADPHLAELGRIANLIEPCGMIGEARRALALQLGTRFVEQVDYQANRPLDEEIGKLAGGVA